MDWQASSAGKGVSRHNLNDKSRDDNMTSQGHSSSAVRPKAKYHQKCHKVLVLVVC